MTAPYDLYVVNYFPATPSGFDMWSSYNGPQYQADMALAKALGFNCLRVPLAARPGVFSFPSPTSAELAKLTDFCNRAAAVGIKLKFSLFDWWRSVGLISASQTWAAAVIGALPSLASIPVIELKNEMKFASTDTYNRGFDGGWPRRAPQYTEFGQVCLVWAGQVMPFIRSLAPGVPVTVSVTNGTADLAALYRALNGTTAAPDWYEWHCYSGKNAQMAYPALRAAIAVVGSPANLFIGETGCATTPAVARGATGAVQGALAAQQTQSDYLQTVRWACQQLGLPEPSPWILYDLLPSEQFASGQSFGLHDTSGNPYLSARMYQAYPPGSQVPAVDLNGAMLSPQPDNLGNVLPARWFAYKGNDGREPITVQIDAANQYQGAPSVLLTGSGATSGSQNPPMLGTCPLTSPLITPGQSYTFSCALKATGSYRARNSPGLAIAWYDDVKGAYLSTTNGPPLSLTSSFARFTLTGTAPAKAAGARLFVRCGYNAGRIWVAGATWTGPSSARR
jgi:hypothetical protein